MTTLNHRLGWTLTAIAGVVIFVGFAAWGGIPTDAQSSAFWAQASMFCLVICAFVLAFWHLLVRPLAPNLRQPQAVSLSRRTREILALILASGGIAIFVGGVWDELWHRSYGIPFGEDLFWRPHLLMYFGFATASAAGFWALLYLNRNLRGNFQQRFRSNTAVGLLILNAAFLLYALPADPIWHWIFGEDITAWSIPHLILLTSFVLTQLLALDLHASTRQRHDWHVIFSLRLRDSLSLLILAGIQLLWIQLMLIDWDASLAGIPPESIGLYRPEWLLAANLLACVTFTGVMATRVLRCAGAATAAGLLALAIRIGLIEFLDAEMLQFVAWVAALLPLLAIDIWAYYCSAIRKREPDWRGTAAAVIAAMALNAFVIRSLYNLGDADNLAYAAAIIVTGLGVSWLANRSAEGMLRQREATVPARGERNSLKPALSVGIAFAFFAFIFVFITTASPPV
ncbi:MAG: hypothetical protein OXI77_09235 [Chloroflexota bacterium]|nr:hypothetical protein [Chloroflexota bacterium]MDE2910817.1 hypothetical protein [Chloroflexota bacterium]